MRRCGCLTGALYGSEVWCTVCRFTLFFCVACCGFASLSERLSAGWVGCLLFCICFILTWKWMEYGGGGRFHGNNPRFFCFSNICIRKLGRSGRAAGCLCSTLVRTGTVTQRRGAACVCLFFFVCFFCVAKKKESELGFVILWLVATSVLAPVPLLLAGLAASFSSPISAFKCTYVCTYCTYVCTYVRRQIWLDLFWWN